MLCLALWLLLLLLTACRSQRRKDLRGLRRWRLIGISHFAT